MATNLPIAPEVLQPFLCYTLSKKHPCASEFRFKHAGQLLDGQSGGLQPASGATTTALLGRTLRILVIFRTLWSIPRNHEGFTSFIYRSEERLISPELSF